MAVIDKIKQVFSTDKPSTEPTATQSTAPAASSNTATAPASAASTSSAPVIRESEGVAFDKQDVTVIFVLGGPGAGKGTQCERIVDDYGFKHLSAGDLLRAEQQREGSQFGAMIKEYITEGKIVPMEVTIKLLENAMRDTMASPPAFAEGSPLAAQWTGGKGRFLIDGFPRKMDQALKFDETVVESSFVLFINTTEQVMLERLLERGKTSGRDDDNKESIVKRFRTFVETSMPVVDHYRQQNKVEEIDSSPTVDQVYAQVRQALDKRLATAAGAAIVA